MAPMIEQGLFFPVEVEVALTLKCAMFSLLGRYTRFELAQKAPQASVLPLHQYRHITLN